MLSKPDLSETLRKELPSDFLDLYDKHVVGGIGISGDFFINHMAILKKHGIYEQLLLFEYVEGDEKIIKSKTLHKAFLACNRETLREICEDMPTDQSEYTVFRGATEERKLGVSWTLCRLRATHFACSVENGRLYQTTVPAQDVLASLQEYFHEDELIIIPQSESVVELRISPRIRKMLDRYYQEGFDYPPQDIKPANCNNCPNKVCLRLFGEHT